MLEQLFKSAGADVFYIDGKGDKHKQVESVETPYKTIVAAKGNPEKIFTGHIDVVPGNESQFEPKQEEDKLIMRGACDMLAPVAAMAHAFEETKADNVWFALSDSEEIGEMPGGIITFVKLYEHLLSNMQNLYAPDGGNGEIVLGQKAVKLINLQLAKMHMLQNHLKDLMQFFY